jgi:hypothetical protein
MNWFESDITTICGLTSLLIPLAPIYYHFPVIKKADLTAQCVNSPLLGYTARCHECVR